MLLFYNADWFRIYVLMVVPVNTMERRNTVSAVLSIQVNWSPPVAPPRLISLWQGGSARPSGVSRPPRCVSTLASVSWPTGWYIKHSHWSSSYIAALSLVESCWVLEYFHARKGPIRGTLSVAMPAVLCHKESAQLVPSKSPYLLLAGSLWHQDSWLPCTERSDIDIESRPLPGSPTLVILRLASVHCPGSSLEHFMICGNWK